MSSATTEAVTVFGIADCHGIEGIFEKNDENVKKIGLMNIRVMANRQRHAVLFEADMTNEGWTHLQKLINEEQDYIEALNFLKNTSLELRSIPGQENSWDLIPNPKLDPWGG